MMEPMMSVVLVTVAIAALVWFGLKSVKANADKPALQPIRIHDQKQRRR